MCLKSIAHNLRYYPKCKRKVIIIAPLLRVKGHLNVVLGHFGKHQLHVTAKYISNMSCHFRILGGITEKVELSNILLHMGV